MGEGTGQRRAGPPWDVLYVQFLQHARHCENERLTFTQIYVVIVAALFSILGMYLTKDVRVSIISSIFIIILSYTGFLMTYALTYCYTLNMKLAEFVEKKARWEIGELHTFVVEKCVPKKVHFADMFYALYLIITFLSGFLLSYSAQLSQGNLTLVIKAVLVISVVLPQLLMWRLFIRKKIGKLRELTYEELKEFYERALKGARA